MQLLEALAQTTNPWPLRRQRAAELAMRYPHATQILNLYQAYVDCLPPPSDFPSPALGGGQGGGPSELLPPPLPGEGRGEGLSELLPPPLPGEGRGGGLSELLPPPLPGEGRGGGLDEIVRFAVDHVLPSVIDATVASGPAKLRNGVINVFCTADLHGLVRRWLHDEPLDPFETYLARAATCPLLEARYLSTSAKLGGGLSRTCPSCGGLPQLSYFAVSGEALVTGPRYLVCSRCATNWVFSRMTCAGCGESDGGQLPIFQESEQFPHIRIDGCRTCHRYLLTVDLRREPRAVPIVDELAALPLDLFAIEQGLTKITPNLMGN